MVSLGRFVELGKSLGMLSPVKFSAVDDHAGNGSTVSTYPFGGRMNDDVGAVVKRSAEIASGAEGVIDLEDALVLVCLIQAGAECQPTTTGTPFS